MRFAREDAGPGAVLMLRKEAEALGLLAYVEKARVVAQCPGCGHPNQLDPDAIKADNWPICVFCGRPFRV